MAGKSGEGPNESRGILGPIAGRTMGAIGRSISNPGSPTLAQVEKRSTSVNARLRMRMGVNSKILMRVATNP